MVLSFLYHFLSPFISIKWLRMVRSPIWYRAMFFHTHVFKVEDKIIKLKNIEDNISAWNLSSTLSFHVIEYFDMHTIILNKVLRLNKKRCCCVYAKVFVATKHNTQMKATALIHPDSLFPFPCLFLDFLQLFYFREKKLSKLYRKSVMYFFRKTLKYST